MIEILFRGKRTDNGEWVEGSLFAGHTYWIQPFKEYVSEGSIDHSHKSLSTTAYKVIPETVGQFTGLLDKGGKKIFDGDIVRFTTDHYVYDGTGSKMKVKVTFASPVVWQEFRALWAVQMNEYANNDLFRYVQNGGDAIVIGNIHDNPELLNL